MNKLVFFFFALLIVLFTVIGIVSAVGELVDSSGNGYDLTNNGGVTFVGDRAYFNGSNYLASYGYYNGSMDNFTLIATVEPTSDGVARTVVGTSYLSYEMLIGLSSADKVEWGIDGSGGVITPTVKNGTGETCIALVNDGSANSPVYLNGTNVENVTGDSNLDVNGTVIGVKDIWTGLSNYFVGYIDDVLFYEGALNSSQVADVCSGVSVTDGLVAKYTFTSDEVEANISPSTAYLNDTLLGYCNDVNDSVSDVIYEYEWFLNGSSVDSGSVGVDGFDVTTAVYSDYFNVSAAGGNINNDIFISSDGLKYYSVGSTDDVVRQFNLTSAWNISTAVLDTTYDISTYAPFSTGLWFNSDGTRMYITCQSGDEVNQFTLSSAWDVGSASFIGLYDAGGEGSQTNDVFFAPNGTRMFLSNADYIYEYDLGTAWTVSTAVYSGTRSFLGSLSGQQGRIWFDTVGELVFVDGVYVGNLASAWDISSITLNSSLYNLFNDSRGLAFSPSGDKLFTLYNQYGDSYSYDLDFGTGAVLTNVDNYSNFSIGDSVVLGCRAYDGVRYSSWYNSSSLTISNYVPVASNVLITRSGSIYNCTYDYFDGDNHSDSGTSFSWYLNSSLLGNTTQSINYSLSDDSELVCTVTPSDGLDNGTSVNSSVYVVGDITTPSISDIVVPTTAYTSVPVTLSVVCTDANSLATGFPKVEFKDPNGLIVGNLSLSLLSGDTYTRSYTFSVAGVYHSFNFYCQDGSGNLNISVASNNLSSSVYVAPVGGGGTGTVVVDKPVCDIDVTPDTLAITRSGRAYRLVVSNDDSLTYSPTIDLRISGGDLFVRSGTTGDGLFITNPLLTLLSGQSGDLGVTYVGENVSGEALLVFTSGVCADITVPVSVDIDGGSGLVFDLGFGTLSEPVFKDYEWFTVGLLWLFVWLLVAGLIVGSRLGKLFNDKRYGEFLLWVLFSIFLASIITGLIIGVIWGV